MPNHRKYNWPELFTKFEQSGLSQVEFCKQSELNPSYFNLKLSKRKARDSGAFEQVMLQSVPNSSTGLVLAVGNCKVHCPGSMPIPSLVSLVKALA